MKAGKNTEFRLLRRRLWLQIAGSVLAGVMVTVALVSLLQGRMARCITDLIALVSRCRLTQAAELYERVFRSHRDLFLWLLILGVVLCLVHLHLRRVEGYLREVNQALGQLTENTGHQIHLSSELQPLERRLNLLERQMQTQQEGIREQEQKKNDLVMYLAHDLKTPLACSIGYLNLLLDEPDIPSGLREKYLRIALTKSLRLEEMVQEFLEISRYSLTTVVLHRQTVCLNRMLAQLIHELHPVLANRNLDCSLESAKDIRICCDPDKLQRVFDNLLRNAVQYSREGTCIQVQMKTADGQVRISVTSQGEPVDRDRLDHVFDPFYRVNPGGSPQGTGLGLAIARQIAEKHGGRIDADSTDGKTCFTVTLPLKEDRAAG